MAIEPDAGRAGNSDTNPPEPQRVPPEGTIPTEASTPPESAVTAEAPSLPASTETTAADSPTDRTTPTTTSAGDSQTVTEGGGNEGYPDYNSGNPYDAYGYDSSTVGHPDYPPTTQEAPADSGDSGAGGSSGAAEPPASGGTDSSGGSDAEEEEGGPVKSFLEHLEDLRWVLVKCATALFLGMLVCLLGTNYVVAILKWPLERAGNVRTALVGGGPSKKVGVALGNQMLYHFKVETNVLGGFDLGTNPVAVLEFVPIQVGTQSLLTLQLTRNPAVEKELNKGPTLYWLGPAAPFISSLHIAFFGGIVLVAPFLLYFIGEYILPALRWKEKKYFLRAFGIGLVLFLTGVSFCYFLIAPLALRAAEQYSLWMGMAVPQWEAGQYFSFICKFMLGMGLGFEMPVVLLALVKIGILDYQKLAAFRRYMIVVNLILGALLTTPEVLTQVLMFIPLQLLYEISIWIAWYWERQDKKREAAAAAGKTN